MRRRIETIVLFLMFLVGLGVLCYPSFSNWWNERTQSHVIAQYDERVDNMKEEEYDAYFEAADAYNEELQALGSPAALSNPNSLPGYEETLDITGTGIMGYITIDKIGVELPIYHGTEANVLQVASGHLKGSSLPVGGLGNHSVISAHRGLPSATLFTHLDELEVGDTFYITILNRIFTYEVDNISIILPTEIEYLYMKPGKDYCTLMTCTPYGINTHRLLVRAHRIDNADDAYLRVTADAIRIDSILVAPVIAAPILLVLLIRMLIGTSRHRSKNAKRSKSS